MDQFKSNLSNQGKTKSLLSEFNLRILILSLLLFTLSCFDIFHTIKISKNEVSGQMHVILPRKMFGQEISAGNGTTTMDQKIEEMKKDPSLSSLKSLDVTQNKTTSNLILSFLYSGSLKSEWKYLSPVEGDLSGFFIPYKDSSHQMIFISHKLPDKLNNQTMGSEFGDAMFKQFTYKLQVQSETKPKHALLYFFKDNGESEQSSLPILGVEGNRLYVLPIECANGNCILILSDQDKINSKEPERIANILKSKLIDNYKLLTKKKEEREKMEAEENKESKEGNKDSLDTGDVEDSI